MLDFSELPKDGIKFEQLIRDLLTLENLDVRWTGVGPDGGRDMILYEKLKGPISSHQRKWLISCKHSLNSKKAIGRAGAGNIIEDCRSIGADGFILACSSFPSASLITRLEEIAKNQNLLTMYWDGTQIENRLLQPNTFSLVKAYFPKSKLHSEWQIYNTFSPAFWAANYREHFFYMSSRLSSKFPYLEGIEDLIELIEIVQDDYLGKKEGEHFLRLRGVYYNDKISSHTVYVDYLYSANAQPTRERELYQIVEFLNDDIFRGKNLNEIQWDVKYHESSFHSDMFDFNNKKFYGDWIQEIKSSGSRGAFLHEYQYL